ncbi:MAG: hypothetical protein K2F79_01600, partial [Muribaculaceae bacterium]|nr:hypothetical protein [Muribaculaceae bacterium]
VYVLSNAIPTREIHDNMPIAWMSAGDIIEDLPEGISVRAFGSTDLGVSFLVSMPDGYTIFHAGDLNYWHWDEESSPRHAQRAKEAFTEIVDRIARLYPSIDLVFFPVDVRQGAHCAAGAEQFLETIATADFFPMHFKGDYEKACDFRAYEIPPTVASRTRMHCLHNPGDHIELK